MFKKIPQETIIRLSYYLRALNYLVDEKKEFVSSRDLADYLKLSAHQLRKDFSYFGNFGKKGIGYPVRILREQLREILGLDREWNVCIVGFGNLAKALSFYRGFKMQGIIIKAAFDIDKKKVDKQYGEVKVYPLEKMEKVIKDNNIEIGIITVPEEAAQSTSEALVRSGVKAILNFAPVKLSLPENIIIKNADLSCQLAFLTHSLKRLKR